MIAFLTMRTLPRSLPCTFSTQVSSTLVDGSQFGFFLAFVTQFPINCGLVPISYNFEIPNPTVGGRDRWEGPLWTSLSFSEVWDSTGVCHSEQCVCWSDLATNEGECKWLLLVPSPVGPLSVFHHLLTEVAGCGLDARCNPLVVMRITWLFICLRALSSVVLWCTSPLNKFNQAKHQNQGSTDTK